VNLVITTWSVLYLIPPSYLFCGCNNWTNEVGGVVIHFGQGHDSKHGEKTIQEIPENGVGIMDRGFASIERIRKLQQSKLF
jgi:putative transposase